MTNNTPDERLLRDYLLGKLPPADREQLERHCAADPELAQNLRLLRAEIAVEESLIAAESRAWMQEWQQTPQPFFFKSGAGRWLLTLVAVAGLSALAWLLWPRPAPENLQPAAPEPTQPAPAPGRSSEPVAATPTPPPAPQAPPAPPRTDYLALARRLAEGPVLPDVRRLPAADPAAQASPLQQARTAYAAGAYEQALEYLAQVDSSQGQSAAFLQAHALFQLRRFDEAAGRFSQLIEANSRQYRYAAEWGLLLCRLAEYPRHQPEVRQRLAALLARPQHPYFQPAKQLEKALPE